MLLTLQVVMRGAITQQCQSEAEESSSIMSWLDLSAKIDAFKRELDGIDDAISRSIRGRSALQVRPSRCWLLTVSSMSRTSMHA